MTFPKKLPKNVELVSSIASHLDSELEVGEKRRMTPLSNEIGIHKDTLTNKLIEGFLFKDVLKNYKPTFEGNNLTEIEKIQQINTNEEILKSLLEIKRELKKR